MSLNEGMIVQVKCRDTLVSKKKTILFLKGISIFCFYILQSTVKR